jgi:hypothetical protein
VPVLDKITIRAEFNKTESLEAGMVVKRGDRYQDVVAVDRNGSTVTVRDDERKIALVSPKELITGDVQQFAAARWKSVPAICLSSRRPIANRGRWPTSAIRWSRSAEGNIRLKEGGRVTINPERSGRSRISTTGWAVLATPAEANSDYVIALEAKDGRKALLRRAFSTFSLTRQERQIYTTRKRTG